MASTQQSRVLRVGVAQDGCILEERLLRKSASVTIGMGPKNTFVLPLPDLPAHFTLFEHRKGQYQLVFTEDMQGRVDLGSSVVDFQTLRVQGQATTRGMDQYVLPLPESARGMVRLEHGLSLFFQFVTPPPLPGKADLPAALQGGLWRTLDRVFFTILAASLLLHFSGAALIIAAEPPPEPELSLDELPERFARVLMPPKQEEKKPQADTAQAAATETKKPQKDADDEPAKPSSGPSSPEEAAARRAEAVKKVQGKGLLKILGSSGGSGGGAFADVLGGSTGGGDIAAALAGAGGVGVATEASVGSSGPRGGGTGKVAGIGSLGTSGGGNVNLGTKKEVKVSGRVRDAAPEVESSDVDRNALAHYVKARLKAIQNCYEKELKRNPSLKGKVVIRFTIGETGRVTEFEVDEDTLGNNSVVSCIRNTVRMWMFPIKDNECPVAYPFVFMPSGS